MKNNFHIYYYSLFIFNYLLAHDSVLERFFDC